MEPMRVEKSEYGLLEEDHARNDRLGFIRKVYGILSV